MVVSNERLWEMYENHECSKDCKTCPLFLKNRNECIYEADNKLDQWQQEQHTKFHQLLKEGK